jgi:hypothetical protein
MMQVLFVMFLLIVMAECLESEHNTWRENLLKWFEREVHPGLISGNGYLDRSIIEDICEI